MNIQAPPNLSYDDFPQLLDAGINDWGGVSPVTIDHVNPEAPWPEIERLAGATRAAGLELAARLPVYPEYVDGAWLDPAVMPHVLAASDSVGLAREGEWTPGADVAIPFVPRDALPVDSRDELGEDEIVRLFRARGAERDRVFAAADHLRRELNGDTVTYVVTQEHPVHERLLLQVRLLRVLQGQARGEPPRAGLSLAARGDRAARRGGVGARRCRGLPAGRHPSGLRR